MTIRTIYSAEPDRITALKDKEGIRLFRDLLYCEATRLGLSNVVISLDTNIPDGGIDATAEVWDVAASATRKGSFHFQIKTGTAFKPWQRSQVRNELIGSGIGAPSKEKLGSAVRQCLEDGGIYVLITLGYDLTPARHASAESLVREYFRACGYKQSSIIVLGAGQIARMLELYPSLCLDLADRGDAAFQSLTSWATNSDMKPTLEVGEPQREFTSELIALMKGRDIQHVRIVGEPGIGKTRLVLEALRSDPDLAARCIYVPKASLFQNSKLFNELLKADREYWVLLVIDECDETDRAPIWAALKGRDRLNLITIDHGPEQTADAAMRVMLFPPLAQQQIEAILASYIDAPGDLSNWAAWCGGSARVAHAVGENLKRNPDDFLKSPSTVPIWDRFIVGYKDRNSLDAQRLRVVMRHLALVRKFGFKRPVAEEGRSLAAMCAKVDPSITPGLFSSLVQGLVRRRILQGSHTLRIIPKALHVYLWKEWWENYGDIADLNAMLIDMPLSLRKWFLDMFIYANGVPSAQNAVRSVLSNPGGPFRDKAFLTSDAGTRFIDTIAEADPATTISLLESTFGKWPTAELEAWQTGRQNIVFALEKIAVWDEHFAAAATLLARLALGEKSTNSNNAKGTLLGLYEFRFGPTQASPSKRLALAKNWLTSADPLQRKLGLSACAASLNLYGYTRIVGVEYQGLKPAIAFWQPKIWDDLFKPWREAMEILIHENRKDDVEWKLETSREIIQRLEGMLSSNILPSEAVDLLVELATRSDNDLERLTQLVVRMQQHPVPALPDEIIARLRALEKQLGEGDFSSRFRRFVVFNIYDEDYIYGADEQIKESDIPDKHLAILARELIESPSLLDERVGLILQSNGYRITKFGRHVALVSGNNRFDQRFLALALELGESTKPGFLSGYLIGTREIDPRRWEKLALSILEKGNGNRWGPLAVIFAGFTPAIVQMLVTHYLEGLIESSALRTIGWPLARQDTSIAEAGAVLDALLRRPDAESSKVAIEIANNRFCIEVTRGHDPEELLSRVLSAREHFTSDVDTMHEYHWTTFAKRFLKLFPNWNLSLLSSIVASSFYSPRLNSVNSMSEIGLSICEDTPREAWKIIAKALTKTGIKGWSLRRWLGDSGTRQSAAQPLIQSFEVSDVMKWIDRKPAERVRLALDFVPKTLSPGKPGDLARAIIESHGGREAVSEGLMVHFDTGVWWGPRSTHLSKRREEARSWLSANSSVRVQKWIDAYIRALTNDIEQAAISEEREF